MIASPDTTRYIESRTIPPMKDATQKRPRIRLTQGVPHDAPLDKRVNHAATVNTDWAEDFGLSRLWLVHPFGDRQRACLRYFGEFGLRGAGSVYTHENFQSTDQNPDQNVEALFGLQYQLFRFDRYSMQSQLLVYPGLSDYGRIRTTTKTTFSVKLVNNFHTDFSFWDNFDSRPPNNAKRNNLGISNSIGWTF